MVTQEELRRIRQRLQSITSQTALRSGGLREQIQRKQTESQLQKVKQSIAAQEINEKLKGTSFKSISDLKTFQQSLSPQAQQCFQSEINKAEAEQQKRIKELSDRIQYELSVLKQDKFRIERAGAEGGLTEKKARAEYQGQLSLLSKLREGLDRLKEGELLDVSSITSVASRTGSSLQQELTNSAMKNQLKKSIEEIKAGTLTYEDLPKWQQQYIKVSRTPQQTGVYVEGLGGFSVAPELQNKFISNLNRTRVSNLKSDLFKPDALKSSFSFSNQGFSSAGSVSPKIEGEKIKSFNILGGSFSLYKTPEKSGSGYALNQKGEIPIITPYFNVLGGALFGAGEATAEATGLKSLGKKVDIKLGLTDYQISKEPAKKFVSDVLMISSLSPFMATGTTSILESEYVYDYRLAKWVKKGSVNLDLNDLTNRLISRFDDAYIKGGEQSVLRELSRITRTAKDTRGIENLLKILKSKGYISGYAVDTEGGAFTIFARSNIRSAFSDLRIKIQIPKLRTLPVRSTTTPVTVLDVKPTNNIFIKSGATTKDSDILGVKYKPLTSSGIGASLGILSGLKLGSSFMQPTKEATGQKTPQKTRSSELLSSLSLLSLKTAQQQQSRQQQRGKSIKTPQPVKPIPKPIIPLFPKLSSGTLKRLAKKTETQPELFKVFTKEFGKDIKIFETTSKKKAEEKLASILSGTLRASGFITKGGEKLKASELRLLKSPVFRVSKQNPFSVVQRRKYRLSSPFEKKEIQYFKKRSKSKKPKSKNLYKFF